MRQVIDNTRPDIIIPGKVAYDDPAYPLNRLFMVGIKRTCKDRWRQVTNEAPRIKHKHILTLQEGISDRQLEEMQRADVTLIVPNALHKEYPADKRADLLTVQSFIQMIKDAFASV